MIAQQGYATYEDYFRSKHWVRWVNASDSTCPGFGSVFTGAPQQLLSPYAYVYRVVGNRELRDAFVTDKTIMVLVGIPPADESLPQIEKYPEPIFVGNAAMSDQLLEIRLGDRKGLFCSGANGPLPVKSGGIGIMTFDEPYYVAVESSASTSKLGESLSPRQYTWKLTDQSYVFQYRDDTVNGLMHDYGVPIEPSLYVCVSDDKAAFTKDPILLVRKNMIEPRTAGCIVADTTTPGELLASHARFYDPFDGSRDFDEDDSLFGLRMPSDPSELHVTDNDVDFHDQSNGGLAFVQTAPMFGVKLNSKGLYTGFVSISLKNTSSHGYVYVSLFQRDEFKSYLDSRYDDAFQDIILPGEFRWNSVYGERNAYARRLFQSDVVTMSSGGQSGAVIDSMIRHFHVPFMFRNYVAGVHLHVVVSSYLDGAIGPGPELVAIRQSLFVKKI